MKVTLLGTGSPIPDPDRAGPATLVTTDDARLLVDAGRGVCMRLMAAGCPPPALTGVLITHLHSDHITDLNDVATSHWILAEDAGPLRIWGPPGTKEVVEAMAAMLGPDRRYRLDHHADLRAGRGLVFDVTEVEPGDVIRLGETEIGVHRTDHRPVEPSVGYRISDARATAAIAGDTIRCTGLDELCAGADVYVQTVIRDDQVRAIAPLLPMGDRMLDICDYHSTVEQAAVTAARAGVGTLVLTHCVPAVRPGAEDEWIAIASARFGGQIVLGPDLTSVEV
jgi:ribonuclease Z